jgi:hypothetical protein
VWSVRKGGDSLCELAQSCTKLQTGLLTHLVQELDKPGEIGGLTADGVVGFAER